MLQIGFGGAISYFIVVFRLSKPIAYSARGLSDAKLSG
jgi:hypothetical protein